LKKYVEIADGATYDPDGDTATLPPTRKPDIVFPEQTCLLVGTITVVSE